MKMSELWIAFAGTQLTSAVSNHETKDGRLIKVIISGIFDEESAFVGNVILAAVDSGRYHSLVVDVHSLVFFEGVAVNEYAIDCLTRLIGFVMNREIKAILVVDNNYVREVLGDVLRRHRGFKRIEILSSRDFTEGGFAADI